MDHDTITGELTLPYYLTSFAAAASGSDDEDDDRDDEDLDDTDDDEDEDADKSDEELREELKKTRSALAKANGQSAKRRKALREREAELEEARKPKPRPKKGGTDDDGPDLDTLRDEARREGEKAGTLRAKRSEARGALRGAGVDPESLDFALRSLDLDDMDLDDDGLDGIDDAIEELRAKVPALFAKKRNRRESVAGDRDAGEGRQRKAMTTSERQAALITGKAR